MKTTMKAVLALTGLAAGAALADGAAATVCTFESTEDGWSGGTLTAATPAAPANGYAVTDATHGQVLAIDGTATSSVGATGNALVDILFQVSIPEVAPALPSGEYFAIAVATDGSLVAFTNSTAEAVTIDADTHSKGEWIRVTTLFDYTNNRCQVALNGELACGGAWLPIAATSLSGIAVSGTTTIDDVVVQSAASTVYDKYAAVTEAGAAAVVEADGDIAVPANYLTVNNLAATTEAASAPLEHSSPTMTVAQAYLVGVAPVAGATFAIEKASFNGSSLTLTFPGDWPAGSYTVKYGATPECANKANIATATKTGSGNQVTIPLNFGSGNVLYYKVTR